MKKQFLLILFYIIFSNSLMGQILGIDVYHNNGKINWPQVKSAGGKVFAWTKATEGLSGVGSSDDSLINHMKDGTNAGIVMGVYHVARPDNNKSGVDEANHFLDVAKAYIGKNRLPPALDLEGAIADKVDITVLTKWIQDWMSTVQNETKVPPILYIDQTYVQKKEFKVLNIYKLWVADPDGLPASEPNYGSWSTWTFKQYAGTDNKKTVPGMIGTVDLDVFNGDLTAFNNLIGTTSTSQSPDLVVQSPQISPSSVYMGLTVTASCINKNVGTSSAAASYTSLWLSADQKFDGAPTDTYIADIQIPALASGQSSSVISKQITIPTGPYAGKWYVMFGADGTGVVNEDKSNNQVFIPITFDNTGNAVAPVLTLTPECNATTSQITLTWTASAGATSYDIYRDGSLYKSGITGLQFQNTTVSANQSYSYYVLAKIPSGNLASKTLTSVAPDCSISSSPGKPNLTATADCNGASSRIVLNWTMASNTIAYDIYRENAFVTTVNSGTQYVDNTVIKGTTYQYYVRATNGSGGTNSDPQSAKALDCTALPNPLTLTVTPNCNGTSSQVILNWTASNTKTYNVYRNNTYYYTVLDGSTQYYDNGVSSGTTYNYYVEAFNGSGATKSNELSATAGNCAPNFPDKPIVTLTPVCNGSTSQIRVDWTAGNNTKIYVVYRDNVSVNTSFGDTRYLDESVTSGVTYNYYVQALNDAGNTKSDIQQAKASDCSLPPLPDIPVLSISPRCDGESSQIILDWTSSTGTQAYDIYRDGVLYYSNITFGAEFVDASVTKGQTHSYYVLAKNAGGSTKSNTLSFIAPNCTISIPLPTISSVAPLTAKAGSTVTITGTNLTGATSVVFGGVAANSFTVISPNTITAIIGQGASGDISLTTAGGTTTFSGFNFEFDLPANNFRLAATDATCRGVSNGKISITALQNLNYTATLTFNGSNTLYPFTTTREINNLAAGTYHICISVDGKADYQRCYDLIVKQPQDLSVYSTVNTFENTVTLSLTGGENYNIELNGANYSTSDNIITLPLREGANNLMVSTDKLCQGTFEKIINVLKKIVPYPNPFQSTVSINLGNDNIENIHIQVYGVDDGKPAYSKDYSNLSGVIRIDLGSLKKGIYALHVSLDNTEKIFKIIKQ